jgi:hypothetical protein
VPPLHPFPRPAFWIRSAVARGWIPFDWVAPWFRRDLRPRHRTRPPLTFTEKVCHKLAHDRRPLARTYADKLAVRDHVRATCPAVRLPRLLAHVEHEDDILSALPPAPWVMKASHGSGMILICDRPGAVTPSLVYQSARSWLRRDYGVRFWEWQYLGLPRRILFEEYLGRGRQTPDDFKFYVMHQQVRFIEVDQARYIRHTRDFFWPDWTPITSRIGPAPTAAVPPARPANLAKMIAIAEALGAGTDFVRVDLYSIGEEIFFGELTHSPAAGKFDFADPALDLKLGSCWTLPARYETDGDSLPPRIRTGLEEKPTPAIVT